MKKILIIGLCLLAVSGMAQKKQSGMFNYLFFDRMLGSGSDSLISPADTSGHFWYSNMENPVSELDGVNKRTLDALAGTKADTSTVLPTIRTAVTQATATSVDNSLLKTVGTSGRAVEQTGVTVDDANIVSAPTFSATNLTDGYVPYHISDALGQGNSVIYNDAVNSRIGIGTTVPETFLQLNNTSTIFSIKDNRNIQTWLNNDLLGQIDVSTSDATGIGSHSVFFIKAIHDDDAAGYPLSPRVSMIIGVGNYNTVSTERLRLNYAGNFGIGTSIVMNKLDVEGAVAIGSSYSGASTAPSHGLLVQGNTGIGTSIVMNKLDVEGAVAIGSSYSGTNTAPANGLIIQGNTGIGCTSPTSKLSVLGTAATNNNLFNYVHDTNKVRTTFADATDTSSAHLSYTSTGSPEFHIVGKAGNQLFLQDSVKTVMGSTTNNTTFESDGSMLMSGTATVFDDLFFPFESGESGVTNIPVFVADSSYYTFTVDSTGVSKCIKYFTIQMPHSWKEGSTIYPHVHYKHETAVGTPKFIMKYKWYNTGESTAFGWNWYKMEATTGTDNNTVQMSYNSSNGISGSGKTISSILICQVYLSGVPTNVNAYQFDIHIEKDRLGSRTETTK